MKKNIIAIILIIVFLLAIVIGYYFLYYRNNHLDPDASTTYYKIFNKDEILDGTEENATQVNQKLDRRLKKYHKTFEKMAGTTDEGKLKALFYMNFVHMYGYYGKRELSDYSFNHLLRDSEYFHCGTNTTFLAMLLDKAGYEFRTVSSNNGNHGFVEVKFDNHWQILDPTINTWIDKSFEEIIANQPRITKTFFIKGLDQSNEKSQDGLLRVANIFDLMLKMGEGYKGKIDQYNYIDLSKYQY